MSAEFINELLRKADPHIRKHGGEEGYALFRMKDAISMSKSLTIEDVITTYIDSIDKGEDDSAFFSRTLLSMYIFYEGKEKTPLILKNWVLSKLLQVSNGDSADCAFSLLSKVGQKHTKPMYNQIRCVCFVTLKLRSGMNKSQAILACVQEFGIAERHIYRFLKDIEVNEDVSDNTLIFFRDNDVLSDYSTY